MEDRLMTIKQVATYLNVNERTVLKLVQDGSVPGVKVGNQWRFRKAMIDTWLDDQMLGITPRYVESKRPEAPSHEVELATSFEASHILPEMMGVTKTGVIVELATHAQKLGLVRDATWFVGALIQRENVMPSGIRAGVAFLHTLHRHPEQIVKPFMVFGRARKGIDFDALDGKPTYLFFVLGLKYDELHLPWLAKLVQMLAQADVTQSLLHATDATAIYETLVQAERKLGPTTSDGA